MQYPKQAEELKQLLRADQEEKKRFGRSYFHEPDKTVRQVLQAELRSNTTRRSQRLLEILDETGEPSISNIGVDAAQAVSVLAVHDGPAVLAGGAAGCL